MTIMNLSPGATPATVARHVESRDCCARCRRGTPALPGPCAFPAACPNPACRHSAEHSIRAAAERAAERAARRDVQVRAEIAALHAARLSTHEMARECGLDPDRVAQLIEEVR